MSFSYISKISLYFFLIFILSCQDPILSFDKKDNLEIKNEDYEYDTIDIIDLYSYEKIEKNVVDIYTTQSSSYNFLEKKLKRLKINNHKKKYSNSLPVNVIYHDKNIYSINSKAQLVKFSPDTGKIIDKYTIDLGLIKNEPVSFSLYKNDFIVSFKSGEVARINKLGQVIWIYNNQDFLNTPVKIYENKVILLYSEKIIFLEISTGDIIFEKIYKSNNIIQSSGGKIQNYFNILFFILSNSEFNSLDTFLFEEHSFNFDQIELNTSLNNLKDQIHIYQNYLVYLDNGNIFHTYDINKNEFILKNYRINETSSAILFNNAVISKNKNYIEIYNIKNGKLFSKININKIFKKNSIIINALIINGNMHIFGNNGELIIFDEKFNIKKTLNLKIKNINKVYSYQDKIFVNSDKGITYIF